HRDPLGQGRRDRDRCGRRRGRVLGDSAGPDPADPRGQLRAVCEPARDRLWCGSPGRRGRRLSGICTAPRRGPLIPAPGGHSHTQDRDKGSGVLMAQEASLTPGTFDLEAFVSGAVVATEVVEVSSKAGLAAKRMALMPEHETASKSTDAKSKRLAEKDGKDTADLQQQIRDIADELDGSWVEVEITAATPTQR